MTVAAPERRRTPAPPALAAGARAGGSLYERLRPLEDPSYTPERCAELSRVIDEIRDLKVRRNAVILAHNYQRPEIFEVADFVGDSLELARQAAAIRPRDGRPGGDVIVFCGVHFMAETAKILNPEKTVLLPNLSAGCSLADSCDAGDLADRIDDLKRIYPDLAVVGYVNTSAATKALCDVCCTSSNAVRVVESLPAEHILFVPDRNLASHVQERTRKTIIAWDGDCHVHEQIRPEEIERVRAALPHVRVLVHPECREDVRALADAVLSTSQMGRYARESGADAFLIVTECGLSDRLTLEAPGKTFYKSCKLCRFMKAITLEETRDALRSMRHEIVVPEEIRARAERAIRRMLEVS